MITKPTITAVLIVLCSGLSACKDEPEPMPVAPVAVAEPEPEPEPEPPQAEFPVEENALVGVKAMSRIPAKATFVGVTKNPRVAFELLGIDDPGPAEGNYGPGHQPELLDLAPSRLTGGGFDPEKPVGVVMFGKVKKLTDGPRWAVFASLADEAVFREAFGLVPKDKKTGIYKPTDIDDQRLFLAVEDEIVIFNRSQPVAAESSVAADLEYDALVNTLDYGSLFTCFLGDKRGMALWGAGVDNDGFGIKAVAETDVWAATMRIKGPTYAAGFYAELPFTQRVVNKRMEVMQIGANIRHDIDQLQRAPLRRRVKAAKALPTELQEIASLDGELSTKRVAGRRWVGSPADIAAGYEAWVSLDYTEEEREKLDELVTSLETMEVLDGLDVDEVTAQYGTAEDGTIGAPGSFLKMGSSILSGGGRKKGKGSGGGPMDMLGKMGNLGGMLGGSGASDGPDLKINSSDRHLKSWANKGLMNVFMCAAKKSGVAPQGTIRGTFVIKPDGTFKSVGVSGKDPHLKKCVRDNVTNGGRVPAREIPVPEDALLPDGSAPEGYEPTSKEWVKWVFTAG